MGNNYFETIIGYEEIKNELEKILDVILNKEKYQKLNALIPSGVLLNGNPGLGKTKLAECFIEASKLKSYTIRKDKPDGDFVNYISETFDEAINNAPSIVFLDDLDKYASDDNSRNQEEFVTVQSCIDRCKNKNVFVIATTNKLRTIPDSLLRSGRMDKIIYVYPPEIEDAKLIVDYYLKQKSCVKDIDTNLIAKIMLGESCATLEKVINEAGILAGFAGKDCIEMDDMIRAVLEVLFDGCELNKDKTEMYKKIAAYHESGHTLVQELLEPNTVNLVCIKNFSSRAGGITCQSQDDNYFVDNIYRENRVKTLLAGKAATEVVFGMVDTGSSSDLSRAYKIIDSLNTSYCAQGFDVYENEYESETYNNTLRAMASTLLNRFYMDVKRMLVLNRDKLDKLANELMEKDYLLDKDIQRLIA